MDPRAIVTSLPLLRRVWKWLPAPLRLPVLLVGALVGIWYLVSGRSDKAEGRDVQAEGRAQQGADQRSSW